MTQNFALQVLYHIWVLHYSSFHWLQIWILFWFIQHEKTKHISVMVVVCIEKQKLPWVQECTYLYILEKLKAAKFFTLSDLIYLHLESRNAKNMEPFYYHFYKNTFHSRSRLYRASIKCFKHPVEWLICMVWWKSASKEMELHTHPWQRES